MVGECDSGGELTAFTPHRTTVSPECTRAEPSAVDMEPGGETTHTISIALSCLSDLLPVLMVVCLAVCVLLPSARI